MGYVNDDRMKELWERIKTVFARKEEIPDIPDIEQPIADTLDAAKDYTDAAYQQSTGYTDQKIAELIGGAPSTMDTLKEVADAMQANKTVVDALDEAIGKKAEAVEVDAHTGNTTVHITASERAAWNGKLDKTGDAGNVTTAFTPAASLSALTSREKLSVSLGKIAKAVSTLISHISTSATAGVLGHVKVDTALSSTSTNPVQNKAIQAQLTAMKKSFQDGCDSLYDRCVLLGVTPFSKTPDAIIIAMDLIYKKGWNDAPKGMQSYHSLGESGYKNTFTYRIVYGTYPDLDLLTADNFILILKGIRGASGTAGNGKVLTKQPTISYIYYDSKGYGEVKVENLQAYPTGQTGSYGTANVEVGFFQ